MKTYTTGEVAAFCGVQKMTVIRWIERGELEGYQLPGRGDRRIREKDLLDFMTKNGMPIPPVFRQHGCDILVIDDDEGVVHAVERVLRKSGYELASATDSFRAGSMLESLKPRLLILDLMMPGMSGLEVLGYLRKERPNLQVKVLILSAAPPELIDCARELQADAILTKPFLNEELRSEVARLLEENDGTALSEKESPQQTSPDEV